MRSPLLRAIATGSARIAEVGHGRRGRGDVEHPLGAHGDDAGAVWPPDPADQGALLCRLGEAITATGRLRRFDAKQARHSWEKSNHGRSADQRRSFARRHPFKRDLSPDVGRFIAHCKWPLSQDCGLAVFGTNSEANSMSAKERMGLLEAIVSAGVPTDRMMPGTGACSINEAAEVSAHATKLGVGGVLMLPPFYYKGVPEEGLFRFFSEVVQRVGDDRLRVYLYHIPPVSAVPITHKLVERLMKALSQADRRHEGTAPTTGRTPRA